MTPKNHNREHEGKSPTRLSTVTISLVYLDGLLRHTQLSNYIGLN